MNSGNAHIAWASPHVDINEGRIKFSPWVNHAILSGDDVDMLYEISRSVAPFRTLLTYFLTVKFSFMDLQDFLHNKGGELFDPKSNLHIAYRPDFLAKMVQTVQSFLFSVTAMHDQFRSVITKFGETEVKKFETTLNTLFDNYFSYRLCYNLRNHSMHKDMPFTSVPFHVEKKSDQGISIRAIPLIEKEPLIKNLRLNKKFRETLEHIPENTINLYPYLQDYFLMHAKLFLDVVERLKDQLTIAKSQYDHIRESMPEDVTGVPAIYFGPHPSENLTEFDLNVLDLMLPDQINKECDYIKKLMGELDAPVAF